MAFRTGTAADHLALWNTLLDFLQNDAALVAAGQAWTVAWQHPTAPELVLKGPGSPGADEVLVGLKRTDQTLAQKESLIWMSGCTGVIPSAVDYTQHVNSLTRTPAIFLDHNPMQYWMVANGRRFVVVVKISTIYQAAYGGLYLPYANPVAYPYPLFVGGSRGLSGYNSDYIATSWRESEQDAYRHFAYARSKGDGFWFDSQAFMLTPQGSWAGGTIDYNGTVYALPRFVLGPRGFPDYMGDDIPFDIQGGNYSGASGYRYGYNTLRSRLIAGLNGEFPLIPITIMGFNNSQTPDPVTYGVLDGCYSVPGVGNVAENLVTVNGVGHLVVPNVMRTNESEYWALALE